MMKERMSAMSKKYLAYISPVEDIAGKEYAACNITFITGELDHETLQGVRLKTDIFKYYYFGSTIEVVVLDDRKNIVDIHDITMEDAKEFGVSLYNVLTLNKSTFDMLVSNDFTYNLKVNKFYNYRKSTVENMYAAMQKATSFLLRVYVINGAIVYIEMDDNPKRDSRYVLSEGYIVTDKSGLRHSAHLGKSASGSGNEKLSQQDIDVLITRLIM